MLIRQIYRDITGKTKCITTKDFGEILAIKGNKGIPIHWNQEEQKSFLQKLNTIYDTFHYE